MNNKTAFNYESTTTIEDILDNTNEEYYGEYTQEEMIGNTKVYIPKKEKKEEQKKSDKLVYLCTKRVIDIILSFIGLVVLSPIFLIIATLIKIDSKGPVIYKHKRVGKDGKHIYLYKFRSMVYNADEMKKNFTPKQKKEYLENFKLRYDPRITKVGDILRKTSLDELPQILNILKGDMSIIGPRPVVDKELEKYEYNKEKFLSMKPGLTGYWAANGRSCTSYEQRMEMELYYIDNISLIMDIKVFFQTIISVLKRKGAM